MIWDDEVDVLVIGSGAAGMTAALAVAASGLKVAICEKAERIGGTSATSAGTLWVPGTQPWSVEAGDSRAAIRYVRQSIEAAEVRRHIEDGKQCTRLAMTWADRISFVLTETLTLKRIAPLDVIKEGEGDGGDAAERFDSDFTMMAGELSRLLADLVGALGQDVEAKGARGGKALSGTADKLAA